LLVGICMANAGDIKERWMKGENPGYKILGQVGGEEGRR
jgi:hypothetical protein